MKKFYAVKNGRKNGIYESWDDCKNQVHNFPNAIYKSFKSKIEAEDYLRNTQDKKRNQESPASKKIFDAIAYVDGSFNIKTGVYGYGVVIFIDEKKYKFSGSDSNKDFAKHRNVAGEIFGAIKAVEVAIDSKCKSIEINYDYTGIENWATKNWKANTDLTSLYSEFMGSKKEIKIYFNKVKAHSGNEFNDEADKLAKRAAGLN